MFKSVIVLLLLNVVQRSVVWRSKSMNCHTCGGVIHRLRWRLLATINLTRTHSVSMATYGDLEKSVQLRHFCTYRPEILHIPRGRQYAQILTEIISNVLPWKIWRPFEFCVCITANGTKNFKSIFRSRFQTYWTDLLTRTSPKAWKLSLRFSRVGNSFNSIYLHFCMFHAPFNISGTLEANELKFSHSMHLSLIHISEPTRPY